MNLEKITMSKDLITVDIEQSIRVESKAVMKLIKEIYSDHLNYWTILSLANKLVYSYQNSLLSIKYSWRWDNVLKPIKELHHDITRYSSFLFHFSLFIRDWKDGKMISSCVFDMNKDIQLSWMSFIICKYYASLIAKKQRKKYMMSKMKKKFLN